MECDMCHQTGVPLKTCSACKTVNYCSATCQTAAWVDHRAACNRSRKERESSKAKGEVAKEMSSGSGSGLRDMGSIMAALNMQSQQQEQQQQQQQQQQQSQQQSQQQRQVDIYNACLYGRNEDLRKMLLHSGVDDIDWARPDTGETAAFIAADKGHDKCLALLISKGANLLKVTKGGYAPIHMACQCGKYSTVALLLDSGVDASLPTSHEREDTPAIICSFNGHVKLLALLLDRGSDPNLANKYGSTAAHLACVGGHVKCIKLLIKRGANIKIRNQFGHTPLDSARTHKHRECEDLLLLNDAVGMDVADIPDLNKAQKEKSASYKKEAKSYQKESRGCDNPACQTSPDDKSKKRPKKCAACEVALYCCAACQTAHWPAHAMLCQELR